MWFPVGFRQRHISGKPCTQSPRHFAETLEYTVGCTHVVYLVGLEDEMRSRRDLFGGDGPGNCVFSDHWVLSENRLTPTPTPLSFSTETLKPELIFCSLLRLACPPSRMSSLWLGTLAQLLIRAALSGPWPLLKEGWPLVRQNPKLSCTNRTR